eukprot:CAMPEP_0201576224 /NCGR_PEP_ID=MMETSP0190_2-20130828/21935_1 /ASSEMBLY_ACC=CAM_ASM_000263 /TAXON_ID=37353 /ORGANISM="Rosalina sp." /LENGTH=167 /DNA_ID=CAMNT_0048006867 /DNA_START=42 /DNA_END=545 /DNA_ORIENTATION=-
MASGFDFESIFQNKNDWSRSRDEDGNLDININSLSLKSMGIIALVMFAFMICNILVCTLLYKSGQHQRISDEDSCNNHDERGGESSVNSFPSSHKTNDEYIEYVYGDIKHDKGDFEDFKIPKVSGGDEYDSSEDKHLKDKDSDDCLDLINDVNDAKGPSASILSYRT